MVSARTTNRDEKTTAARPGGWFVVRLVTPHKTEHELDIPPQHDLRDAMVLVAEAQFWLDASWVARLLWRVPAWAAEVREVVASAGPGCAFVVCRPVPARGDRLGGYRQVVTIPVGG